MKSLIIYSSNTGNTKKLARKIYNELKNQGDWTLEDVESVGNVNDFDVILLGGWIESGNLNKSSLKVLKEIDMKNKKVGLFVTMGSSPSSEHGKDCENKLLSLLKNYDSLGVKIIQGEISKKLIERLSSVPDNIIPKSVKEEIKYEFENYKEATEEEYKSVANFFAKQLV